MSNAIALAKLMLSLMLFGEMIWLAPDVFEFGGYVHQVGLHVGTAAASILGFVSISELIRG